MKITTCIFALALFSNLILTVFPICMPQTRNRSFDLTADESLFTPVFFNDSYISDCGCGDKFTCVRKCCDEDYVIDQDNLKCSYNKSVAMSIPIYKYGNVVIDDDNLVNFRYISGISECLLDDDDKNSYIISMDDFNIQKDGKLWYRAINTHFKFEHYCVDYDDDFGPIAILCLITYDVQGLELSERLTVIGMMISLPFLFATFIVYTVLPLRNLHGKALICYVFSLFTTYLLGVIIHLHPGADSLSATACRAIAMSFMFFFEASFFWMNVMCIDIYLTFSGNKIILSNRKRIELKRFIWYSVYAWGMPLILIILVLTLSGAISPNKWYNPGISDQNCWLNDGLPMLLYLYLPMAIVIVANVVLFAITAYRIRKVQSETAVLRSGDNKSSNNKDESMRFGVYLKLFLAMGVNWAMEIITWAIDWQVENVPAAVWYFTDFVNAIFGVFIFFIFVCNKKVWKLLKAKYYQVTGKVPVSDSSTDDMTLRQTSHK